MVGQPGQGATTVPSGGFRSREELEAAVNKQVGAAYANGSILRYIQSWAAFKLFCEVRNLPVELPASPHLLAMFLADQSLRGRKPSTVKGDLAGVAWAHKIRGHPDPSNHFLLKKQLQGMTKSGDPIKQMKPLTWDLLKRVLSELKVEFSGYMLLLLRAVYLTAYAASLRISEFAKTPGSTHTLLLDNVSFSYEDKREGMILTLDSYKHSARPARLVVPASRSEDACPVRAVKAFLKVRPKKEGPLFLKEDGKPISRDLVASSLKKCVSKCGLDPELFNTHSFRAGRTTDLVDWGTSDAVIRESGRWGSNAFLNYVRFDVFHLPGGGDGEKEF